MKLLKNVVVSSIIALMLSSCYFESTLPGYQFSLFKDTPVWELAKAVRDEDTATIKELIQKKHCDVNYRLSPRWGLTVLHLAVGNDKLLSVKTLLHYGAKQVPDNSGNYPIHHIVNMSYPHSNRLEILELLLRHGADPNASKIIHYKGDTTGYVWGVPLTYATRNLECTKLLLQYGGNMNLRFYSPYGKQYTYDIWKSALPSANPSLKDENVYVLKYLVLDKKMPVPDTLFLYWDKGKMLARKFIDILNESEVENAIPEQKKAKEEILAYLKAEGYPKHGSLSFK